MSTQISVTIIIIIIIIIIMFPPGTKDLDSKVTKDSWVQRLTKICRREIWNSEREL